MVSYIETIFHIMEHTNGTAIPGTQAILRGIQVLKAFDDHQPEWTLSELVEKTKLNKTTVFRLLSALESEGLVRKSADGGYRLGSEIIALGGRAMRANQLRTVAHDPLRELARQTGETTTLEIIRPANDGRPTTLVIDETLGRYRVGINQYIGSRLPVHATSTGKAMLAFHPEPFIKEVIRWKLKALTGRTLDTAAELRAELAEIRQRGYAIAAGELETGVMAAAAPIFDHMNEVQAAISIVGPTIRVDETQLHDWGAQVKQTTREISFLLGWRQE
ncbi:MAG: IclR family transcriptional regulator [Ardenticatenaceae bacterium]|nr:IclR family transcriptional regulator [Ardenticatenaceae bacterium]